MHSQPVIMIAKGKIFLFCLAVKQDITFAGADLASLSSSR